MDFFLFEPRKQTTQGGGDSLGSRCVEGRGAPKQKMNFLTVHLRLFAKVVFFGCLF